MKQQIIDIIQKYTDATVTDQSTMQELDIDSLSVLEILLDLEDALDINIPENDQTMFFKVEDLIKFVEEVK